MSITPSLSLAWPQLVAGLAAGLVGGGVAAVLVQWGIIANAAPIFLIGVLLVASLGGSRAGFMAAVTSFGLYNFFLVEPRFALQIASTDDFLSLFLFLAIALTVGHFAGRARDQARLASVKVLQLEVLNQAGQDAATARDATTIATIACKAAARIRPGRWAIGQVPSDFSGVQVPVRPSSEWASLMLEEQRTLSPMDRRTIELLARLLDGALERIERQHLTERSRLAEETGRLRSGLINAVAHDLRTPIAGIAAAAAALEDHGEHLREAERLDLARSIRASADRLARFTGKILTAARLETGALAADVQTVSLGDVINAAADGLLLARPDLQIVTTRHDAEITLMVDPTLLEQALFNVLENASAFSPPDAPIEIACVLDHSMARIEISDHGPGIDPELRAVLFDRWTRGTQPNRARTGLGLGLFIARSFMEAMGGHIAAHDRTDGATGTCMVLALPVRHQGGLA